MSNHVSNPAQPPIGSNGKEFTEKWLQALSISASHPAAQRIKPLLNDIDCLRIQRTEQEHLDAAKRLWEYASPVGLQSILSISPHRAGAWRFDGDEAFVFEQSESNAASEFESWVHGLGLMKHRIPMMAIINQDDWSEIMRIEAIRLGKPLSVSGPPPAKESLLWLNCQAEWDRTNWTICFDEPSWITKSFEGPFSVARPELSAIESTLSEAIGFAIKNLSKGTMTIPNAKLAEQPWMQSIPHLLPLHQKTLSRQTAEAAPWFYRTWLSVWPVIYREQNRLRGSCDIELIRRELEASFRNVPQLTIWMFAFAKLICQNQIGSGIGICGEYR
ncbi:MAG: hypothetical protein SGI77_02205 [Pirellulaceae bacterium]|nr:hypothetical protein [Pirellulaceae bacterium]